MPEPGHFPELLPKTDCCENETNGWGKVCECGHSWGQHMMSHPHPCGNPHCACRQFNDPKGMTMGDRPLDVVLAQQYAKEAFERHTSWKYADGTPLSNDAIVIAADLMMQVAVSARSKIRELESRLAGG